jgi:hypothetical protein
LRGQRVVYVDLRSAAVLDRLQMLRRIRDELSTWSHTTPPKTPRAIDLRIAGVTTSRLPVAGRSSFVRVQHRRLADHPDSARYELRESARTPTLGSVLAPHIETWVHRTSGQVASPGVHHRLQGLASA